MAFPHVVSENALDFRLSGRKSVAFSSQALASAIFSPRRAAVGRWRAAVGRWRAAVGSGERLAGEWTNSRQPRGVFGNYALGVGKYARRPQLRARRGQVREVGRSRRGVYGRWKVARGNQGGVMRSCVQHKRFRESTGRRLGERPLNNHREITRMFFRLPRSSGAEFHHLRIRTI